MAETERRYKPPAYTPPMQAAWHHFLFGHVPGWQLDFIVQPELRGDVQRHHTAALRPLFTRLDPRVFDRPSYAIGNLSLYQDEEGPGRGALALLYGQRFGTLSDHAGRPGAFFSHAAVVAKRQLEPQALAAAARQFGRSTLAEAGPFFGRYYSMGSVEQDGQIKPRGEDPCVMDYLRDFAALGDLLAAPSSPEVLFSTGVEKRPTRILLLCESHHSRESKLSLMAELASALFHSGVPWVWITLDVLTSVPQRPEVDPGQLEIHLIPRGLCPASTQESLERTLVVLFDSPLPVRTRLTTWLTTGRDQHSTGRHAPGRPDTTRRLPPGQLLLLVLTLFLVGLVALHILIGPRRPRPNDKPQPRPTVSVAPGSDRDHDGVPDAQDLCPLSAAGSEPDVTRRGCPLPDISGKVESVDGSFVVRTAHLKFTQTGKVLDESHSDTRRILDLLAQRIVESKHSKWTIQTYVYGNESRATGNADARSQNDYFAVKGSLTGRKLRGVKLRPMVEADTDSRYLPDARISHIVLCPTEKCQP